MVDEFQHVSITCRDLEGSISFYEKLGLKVIKRTDEVKEEGLPKRFNCQAPVSG